MVTAHWCENARKFSCEVLKITGVASVVIKNDRRPTSAPTESVLDVDVSLRHIGIALGVVDCAGLYQLSKVYFPRREKPGAPLVEDRVVPEEDHAKPLFREHFWYLNGQQAGGELQSKELNFNTLSHLLEQVSRAKVESLS